MQDISRDDLCLLNGGCDKDIAATVSSTDSANLDQLKLVRTPDLEPSVAIKLEEPSDTLYPWNSTDIGSNLLRHSDDPLLSGAADDNQNEFSEIHKAPKIGSIVSKSAKVCSSPTTMSNTAAAKKSRAGAGAPRTRKKGQFKLRFHHQALPQEYLDHYEASENQRRNLEAQTRSEGNNSNAMLSSSSVMDTPESPHDRTNENIRNWLQKISELQNEGISLTPTREDCVHLSSSPPSPLVALPPKNSTSAVNFETTAEKPIKVANTPSIGNVNTNHQASSSSKVVNYKDLPYMGEMTLENSKPRRGRKPKKADICHLIYKNYGTIFPGTPLDLMDASQENSFEKNSKKLDIQNKIITSLLEKRLTIKSEGNEEFETVPSTSKDKSPVLRKSEEPLNLCVRDVSGMDSVTVSSGDEDEELAVNKQEFLNRLLEQQQRLLQLEGGKTSSAADSNVPENLKMSVPNFQAALMESTQKAFLPETPSTADSTNGVYWSNAGMFLHPMALYYQKMMDASSSSVSNSPRTSPQLPKAKSPRVLVPKNINQLLKTEKQSPPPSVQISTPSPIPVRPETASSISSTNSKGTANSNNQPPQKRKRSAIFIPPMPSENASNPATEVSICKFKFTGGAKPSLQEKKMLSVDSGGNFRYYSGTGDKSMRGYEFFPRESLQQSALAAGSSAGAFLNAHGEKIALDVSPSTPQLSTVPVVASSPLDLISESTQSSTQSSQHLIVDSLPPVASTSSFSVNSLLGQGFQSQQLSSLDRRKRKSRRSLQREKLEKTFKEKGFLIQTQQTESAEGATYCKFRQLKKFTRYLFRSWKDYLPGDFQQQQQHQQQMQIHHQQQQQQQQLQRQQSLLKLKGPDEINK